MMRTTILIIILFLLLLPVFQGYAKETKSGAIFGKKLALMFYLPTLLDIDNYNDGAQSGAGVKMWFTESIAARALVHLFVRRNDEIEVTWTQLGFSGAVEYHFATEQLSPYAGAMGGIFTEMQTEVDAVSTYFVGAFFGVEFQLYKSLSLFGEYSLLAEFEETGYTLNFGTLSEGLIGILIYF